MDNTVGDVPSDLEDLLTIDVDEQGDRLVLTLRGELDARHVPPRFCCSVSGLWYWPAAPVKARTRNVLPRKGDAIPRTSEG